MDFENEMYCEFSKVNQDLVIGSYNEKAFVSSISYPKIKFRLQFVPFGTVFFRIDISPLNLKFFLNLTFWKYCFHFFHQKIALLRL